MTGLLIDGMRRWEVAFFPPEEDNTPQYYEAYFVEIEAGTGVVLVAYSPEENPKRNLNPHRRFMEWAAEHRPRHR